MAPGDTKIPPAFGKPAETRIGGGGVDPRLWTKPGKSFKDVDAPHLWKNTEKYHRRGFFDCPRKTPAYGRFLCESKAMIQVSTCVFDHLRLVNRQPYEMKRYRRFLLGLQPGDVAQPVIEHEADGSCCR